MKHKRTMQLLVSLIETISSVFWPRFEMEPNHSRLALQGFHILLLRRLAHGPNRSVDQKQFQHVSTPFLMGMFHDFPWFPGSLSISCQILRGNSWPSLQQSLEVAEEQLIGVQVGAGRQVRGTAQRQRLDLWAEPTTSMAISGAETGGTYHT